MHPDSMLDETLVRGHVRQQSTLGWAVIVAGLLALFAYFGAVGVTRDALEQFVADRYGVAAAEFTPLALIVLAFPIIGFTFWLADRGMQSRAIACPACGTKIMPSQASKALATRRCGHCDQHVIAGRPHADAVYRRHTERQSRATLAWLLWCWSVLGLFMLWGCPQGAWPVALLGVATGGWSWLRTRQRRYLWPMIAALAVLAGTAAVSTR